MRRISILAVPALSAALALASCSSFLDADKAVSDPNNPTLASSNQLLVGAQANLYGQQEGAAAMTVCIWMQQCAGINGRFVDTYGTYGVTAGSFDGEMASLYTAGGLVGLRSIQASATAAGDLKYRGVAKVLEAMNVMFGTDIWGDVPYSEAVTAASSPKFDTQQSIYTALDALLTTAIADLGGAGTGPGAYDLIYGGVATKWIEAAHTLKARIHLRLVERNGAGEYATVLSEATLGISSAANDFKAFHTGATSERNMWAQFQFSSFGPDLAAGSRLVGIMNADSDPRLPEYFALNGLGTYGGYDVTTGTTPVPQISLIFGSGRANNVTFRQPFITYAENQLIIAEARCAPTLATKTCTGNAAALAAALVALNNARTAAGKAGLVAVTLTDIMTEKYITTFQNVESWNDWKRTCLPTLAPARSKAAVPGRFYWGETEMQTNTNAPTTAENLFTTRNWNDPNGC